MINEFNNTLKMFPFPSSQQRIQYTDLTAKFSYMYIITLGQASGLTFRCTLVGEDNKW